MLCLPLPHRLFSAACIRGSMVFIFMSRPPCREELLLPTCNRISPDSARLVAKFRAAVGGFLETASPVALRNKSWRNWGCPLCLSKLLCRCVFCAALLVSFRFIRFVRVFHFAAMTKNLANRLICFSQWRLPNCSQIPSCIPIFLYKCLMFKSVQSMLYHVETVFRGLISALAYYPLLCCQILFFVLITT